LKDSVFETINGVFMNNTESLAQDWLIAKERERLAVAERRDIEDKLAQLLNFDESKEGTSNFDIGDIKIKVVSRFNRKINAELLQNIAIDNGLTSHLSELFRWSADINAARWRSASVEITKPLSEAITTTPGRPSFAITKKED
jgi:hypothetical protein